MFLRFLYVCQLFLVFTLSFVFGCTDNLNRHILDSSDTDESSTDAANFRVNPMTSVYDLWEIVENNGVNLGRVETVYTMGDREWFDTIYSPYSRSSEELAAEIIKNRRDTWRDLIDGGDWPPEEMIQMEAGLEFLAMDDNEIEDPVVFSVFLSGRRADVTEASYTLSEAETVPFVSDIVAEMENREPHRLLISTAPSNETWLPEYGYVKTGTSSTSGYRYVTHRFYWDDKSGFASSGDYSTYEHEFMLYNYTGGSYSAGTYLNTTSTTTNCYPNLYSSSNNYPASAYAYLDTRLTMSLSCPSRFDEVEFTHGLVFASRVSASTYYTTTMTVAAGTTSTDEFKIQGDIGYCPYSSSTCASYLTWGVYSHGLQERIQPDSSGVWDTTIPGTKYWSE